jgi:LuxR family transcriptional regulator, maltose regulon positive regulatory protein
VNWIENTAMTLIKVGDLLTVLGWLRLFPEFIRSQIKVRLAIAWGLALAMRFEEALRLLTEIEQDVDREAGTQVAALRCECQAIRSVAIALSDDSAAALSISEACLREATDPWTAHVASNVSRFGLWKSGDLTSFYATPWIACSLEEERRGVFASVYRLCLQGLVETQQIRLFVAERCYLDAMRLAEEHVGPDSVAAALPASLMAFIHYEHGRLDEAEAMVIDRLPIINATRECTTHGPVSRTRALRQQYHRGLERTLPAQACASPFDRRCGITEPARAQYSGIDRTGPIEQGICSGSRHRAGDGQVTRQTYLHQARGREASSGGVAGAKPWSCQQSLSSLAVAGF